jgi:hypothetical protein
MCFRSDATEMCTRLITVSRHGTMSNSYGCKWSTVNTKLTGTKAMKEQPASELQWIQPQDEVGKICISALCCGHLTCTKWSIHWVKVEQVQLLPHSVDGLPEGGAPGCSKKHITANVCSESTFMLSALSEFQFSLTSVNYTKITDTSSASANR